MSPDPELSIDESRWFYMLEENEVATRLTDAPAYLGQGGSGLLQTIGPHTGNLVVFPGEPAGYEARTPGDEPQPIYEYNQDDDT